MHEALKSVNKSIDSLGLEVRRLRGTFHERSHDEKFVRRRLVVVQRRLRISHAVSPMASSSAAS